MPIISGERPKQTATIESKNPKATRDYWLTGTYDKLEAQMTFLAISPPFDQGIDGVTGAVIDLYRNSLPVKELGGGAWECTIGYEGTPDTQDLAFTFGGKTAKIYQSLSTVVIYDCINGGTNTGEVPEFDGAIGVGQDGTVEGADIEVASIDFSLTKKWKRATIPATYFNTLADFMAGEKGRPPVNSSTYVIAWMGQTLSFPAGTLRIRTIPIKWNSADEVEICYQFNYERNILTADGWTVGNSSTITKDGQDLYWIRYVPSVHVTSNAVTMTPEAVHIERVYPRKDFGILAI